MKRSTEKIVWSLVEEKIVSARADGLLAKVTIPIYEHHMLDAPNEGMWKLRYNKRKDNK